MKITQQQQTTKHSLTRHDAGIDGNVYTPIGSVHCLYCRHDLILAMSYDSAAYYYCVNVEDVPATIGTIAILARLFAEEIVERQQREADAL